MIKKYESWTGESDPCFGDIIAIIYHVKILGWSFKIHRWRYDTPDY